MTYSEDQTNRHLDRALRGKLAQMVGGMSSHSATRAWADWATHLMCSPGQQMSLAQRAQTNSLKVACMWAQAATTGEVTPAFAPKAYDHRFADAAWSNAPFAVWQQSFLALQDLWDRATEKGDGVPQKDADRTRFQARQMLDLVAPSNFPLTNPEIIAATVSSGGANLIEGATHFAQDVMQTVTQAHKPNPEGFEVGRDIACTAGEVVFANDLFELIQYTPTTKKVQAEPVLIVPAWIMKYYILDLSPENSMIKYIINQGLTVFVMSWCNPGAEHAEWSLEDYRRRGVMAALDAIGGIVPDVKIHANGYCLGGTMLAIAAATMARDGDNRLATVTLMATQVDFAEAGELLMFVDESQVAFVEDLMWAQGYLDRPQMAKTFASIRAEDLIYTRAVHRYFLGREDLPSDIGVWNGDTTRMPARMHSEYLRGLFLENRLTAGRFAVEGRVIALKDIAVPMFVLGTETDHIAPWQSVYKARLFTDCDLTFVLTKGGHNGGVISEPGHKGRHYRMDHREAGALYEGPDGWCDKNPVHDGSWWPELVTWLKRHSSGQVAPPVFKGKSLGKAPGSYIFQL